MKKLTIYQSLAALFCGTAFFMLPSCEQLQSTLRTEQLKDQQEGIGYATADTTVFYYNGVKNESVRGDDAHLVLNLYQFADATDAKVTYTLKYTMNGVKQTASGTGTTSRLSTGKSRYYVDLKEAINLIDGKANPSDDTISLALTVSGLKNDSGNEYQGRTFETFSTLLTFAPLYIKDQELKYSTKTNATAGSTFAIPLNGKITDVNKTVTSSDITDTPFTASVSDDGTAILLTTAEDITGKELSGTVSISDIKPVGSKETYTHEFAVSFTKSFVLNGIIDEEEWQTATTSEDSYADVEKYNLSKVYVTNDTGNLYIALEGDFNFYSQDRIIVMIDNTTSTATGRANTDKGDKVNGVKRQDESESGFYFYDPAKNATYRSVDFYLCHMLVGAKEGPAEMQDYGWSADAPGRTDVKTSAMSNKKTAIEYRIPLTSITDAAAGSVLRVFVTTTKYEYDDATKKNHLYLKDCIPQAAATVTDAETVSIDFSNALEYTVQ